MQQLRGACVRSGDDEAFRNMGAKKAAFALALLQVAPRSTCLRQSRSIITRPCAVLRAP
jgi:hypothetical protein